MPKDDAFFHIGDVFAKEVNRNYLYFVLELNVAALDRHRVAARQAGIAPPSYTAFAVHAIGNALREHPDLNCMICEMPFSRGLRPWTTSRQPWRSSARSTESTWSWHSRFVMSTRSLWLKFMPS